MKTELNDITECRKNLAIEVPEDIVSQEIGSVAREFARNAKVPGFRPGKAPAHIIRSRYREEIRDEVLHHLLPKYFGQAIEERNLDLVDAPRFENVDFEAGKPLRFKAVFEVFPRLDVTNYRGVKVEQTATTVDDAEIEAQIKRLQEEMAEMTPIEEGREIQDGDFAQISFTGSIEGSDETLSAEKVMCEVGGRTTLQEFTDALRGAHIGDDRVLTVAYRDDYPEKRLAGKNAEYRVKVEALSEKRLPEINDEFAQSFGEAGTVDELKGRIRNDLQRHKHGHAVEQAKDKILEWLAENNQFEVPETLVDQQLRGRIERLIRELGRQGINPQRLDVDWSKIRAEQHDYALRDVKGSLILDFVAQRESIDVDDEELDLEIDRIARSTNRPAHVVRDALTKDNRIDTIKDRIRNRKTLDWLYENADVQPAENTENKATG